MLVHIESDGNPTRKSDFRPGIPYCVTEPPEIKRGFGGRQPHSSGGSGEGAPQDKARGLGGGSPAGYGVILNIECAIRTGPIVSNKRIRRLDISVQPYGGV